MIYTAEVVNQPHDNQCVPAVGSQVLSDNEGLRYSIVDLYDRLQANNNLSVLGLRSVLNAILSEAKRDSEYHAGRFVLDPALAFQHLISSGKAWVARVKSSPEQSYGHALVVRGLTEDGLVFVVDPWGRGPGSGQGTLGWLTVSDFMQLWANADNHAVYVR